MPALPKPQRGSAKREKARAKRQEAKHAKGVRAQCVARDGYCLILTRWIFVNGKIQPPVVFAGVGPCLGPSEWAHVGEHRRCHTRGMAPEQRHTTAGSAMMCKRHHDAYDAHEFDLEPVDAVLGMDGNFRVVTK